MVGQSDKACWRAVSCRRPPAALVLGALVAVVGGLTACDTGDGRDLRDPPPGATAPPLVITSTTAVPTLPAAGSGDAAGSLQLTSPAFAQGEPIPDRYACTGALARVSPPLSWTGVPAGTVELAITVVDITTPEPFVHWVVAGLDPATASLGEGAVPEVAVEARNDSSEFGWYGPCPPPGETHTYLFTLFALTAPSGVAEGTGGPEAVGMISSTPGVAATLSATSTGAPAPPGP